MSGQRTIACLTGLIGAQQAEIDRLSSQLASKEALRQRYQANLRTMQQLFDDVGEQAKTNVPALAMNCTGYRQGLLGMMATHQQELTLHEADLDARRQVLRDSSLKCEVLKRELGKHSRALQLEIRQREQKGQDETAAQAWRRGWGKGND